MSEKKNTWYEFNHLKFAKTFLWPNEPSILENILCALEKSLYSAVVWDVLCMSVKSVGYRVSFKFLRCHL